jgi:hypothetical protein
MRWSRAERLEPLGAKWTELPNVGDIVNLDFVGDGRGQITGCPVVQSSAARQITLRANGLWAAPVTELG